MQKEEGQSLKLRNRILLVACIAVVWVAIDFATKRVFDGGDYALGQDIAGPFLGLFRFTLVHNTGAAWGIFAGNTFVLGIFSVAMCVLLIAYLVVFGKTASLGQVIGIGLVVGGGIGNAIDRLAGSYVVDFIDFTFMDFPVFNVADIGVTCGIAIFIVFMLIDTMRADRRDADGRDAASHSDGEGA